MATISFANVSESTIRAMKLEGLDYVNLIFCFFSVIYFSKPIMFDVLSLGQQVWSSYPANGGWKCRRCFSPPLCRKWLARWNLWNCKSLLSLLWFLIVCFNIVSPKASLSEYRADILLLNYRLRGITFYLAGVVKRRQWNNRNLHASSEGWTAISLEF